MTPPPDSDPAKTLDQIVQDFLDAQLQGQDPDIEEIIRAHPKLEHQIRRRLNSLQEVDGLFAGLVEQGKEDPVATALEYDMIGQQLGDFEILKLIGRGGMGAVFLARQHSLDREVALKVIAEVGGGQSKTLERFKREATVLAKLSHAHIVPIYEVGQQGPYAYFAMEYVQGVSLDSMLTAVRQAESTEKASKLVHTFLQQPVEQNRPTQIDETSVPAGAQIDRDYIVTISKIMLDVLAALQYAHGQGVLHRDIKPSNILIDPSGTAKLVDFGLARAQSHPSITVTGEFFGTPNYVSPEQIRNPESVNHRSDLYSLAATYYECLTLRRPFQADTVNETLTNVLSREIIPPRRHSPRLSPDLNTVLLHALEKLPQDRYQSADYFATDIQNVLEFRPIEAKRPGPATRACRTLHRNKLKIALAIILVTIILLGTSLYQKYTREVAHDRALKVQQLLDGADLLLFQGACLGPWPLQIASPVIERAQAKYTQALEIDELCSWALIQRGVSRFILGMDVQESLRDFTEAEKISPDFVALDYLKRKALAGVGNKAVDEIQIKDPNTLASREAFVLGLLLLQGGAIPEKKMEKALSLFRVCINKEPGFFIGHVAHTVAHYYSDSEENLDECYVLLKTKPDCAALHLFAAQLLGPWGLSKLDEAAMATEKAIELQPWNPQGYLKLAEIYEYSGRKEEREAYILKACAIDESGWSYYILSKFHLASNDYANALDACNKALGRRYHLLLENWLLTVQKECLEKLERFREYFLCIEQYERSLRDLVSHDHAEEMGSWCYGDLLDFLCHSGKPAKSKKSLRRRFFGGGGRSDCSADLRGLTLA